ncbi:MAG: hypothetical protein NTV86_08730 [Planctomycetota bacterium]|nr:hypothetical protein [Planctomycetota bacterium]
MNAKAVLFVIMVTCGAGAYWDLTGQRAPLARLMQPRQAGAAEGGYGGILELAPGESITECRQKGRITVFVFTLTRSMACVKLQNLIGQFAQIRPDVAFRFVDVSDLQGQEGDWREYLGVDVRTVPHVMIYDADRRLIAGDEKDGKDGLKLLYEWIGKEHERYGSGGQGE